MQRIFFPCGDRQAGGVCFRPGSEAARVEWRVGWVENGCVVRFWIVSCGAVVLAGCVSVSPVVELRPQPLKGSKWLLSLGVRGVYHTVREGDTLWSIGKRYGVSIEEIVEANQLPSTEKLEPGMLLFIPEGRVAVEPPREVTFREGLVLPARGRITRRFIENEFSGIEFEPSDGKIHSAGDGEVVLVGQNLPAVGRLVLIRHRGGFVSAYSGKLTPTVEPFQIVRRGDIIALVERGERISFRLFLNGEPIDPLIYLR